MAVARRRMRTMFVFGMLLLLVAAAATVFLLRVEPSDAPMTDSAPAKVTGPAATPATSAPPTSAPPTSAPPTSAPPTSAPPTSAGPTSAVSTSLGGSPVAPPNAAGTSADVASITIFGERLVAATSSGDQTALSQLLCGQLAHELATQPVVADPAVYERVADISVAPGGTAATATVYAYKVQRGPPARPLTLALQKFGSQWRACSVVGG